MNGTDSKNLFLKAVGLMGVASLSLLISLPGRAQQSPDNSTNPNVPPAARPDNPASQSAGTTDGGESLQRNPSTNSNGSTMQQNNGTSNTAPAGTIYRSDPSSKPGAIDRVEGDVQNNGSSTQQNNGSTMNQNSTYGQPANQPGSTNGQDAQQQVGPGSSDTYQNNGSTQRRTINDTQNRRQTYPQRQTSPQSQSPTDNSSGSTSTSEQPSNGGVRALW